MNRPPNKPRNQIKFHTPTRNADTNGDVSRKAYRSQNQKKTQLSSSHSVESFLKIGVCVLFFGIVIRLLFLQVINSGYYASIANDLHTREYTIFAKRGTIYDRNGNVLAKSVDCKEIYANPKQIQFPDSYAKILVSYLGGDEEHYRSLLTQDASFVYIKRGLDVDKADKIVEAFRENDLPGIEALTNSKRYYPYGSVANQVLGLVNVDGEGISGLEKQYNDILQGQNGFATDERGANGEPIPGGKHEIKEAVNGTDIVISLDVNIQQIAEEKIVSATKEFKAESGTVVATEPKTGEILALCSTPLADFAHLDELDPHALQLKPISSSYEPGSTFKVLTMSIGIENGIITPHTEFNTPVQIKVGDDWVTDDDKRDVEQVMTPSEMLRRSSNIGSVLIARAIGKQTFYSGITSFGIGSKTGVDFPGEESGLVVDQDAYTNTNLGVNAFGQGLAIPSLQMVKAVGAIANGGYLVTPHFLIQKGDQKVSWDESKQVISKKTAEEVTDMMRLVISEGSGRKARVAHMDVAGKTGTGEQAFADGHYSDDHYMSSLIGFANAKNPDVLLYVGFNKTPYQSFDSSAPTFASIMKEALIDMGVKAYN